MKISLFILGLGFLIAAGCKKDAVDLPDNTSPSMLLGGDTARTWLDFYRSGIKADGTDFVIASPCFIDDHWIFKANGYFEMNEGGSKCVDSDPYVFTTGTWKISADNKYLEMTNIAVNSHLKPSFKFEILELSHEKLSLKIAAADMYVSTTLIEEDHILIAN